jgi:two-component system, cell cycle sensor histidine kinase and response regulator CckA
MTSPTPGTVPRHIVVADEDRAVVAFIIKTLREDGHAVFHAYDVLAATQLAFALNPCDLVLSNTRVEGADGVELVVQLRRKRPQVPIIYLANNGRSTGEIERQLPADVSILREPFTAEKLRAAVNAMLDDKAT